MRLLLAAVFLIPNFLQAQHVTDDSVQYTPIPIPVVKEKKIDNADGTSKRDRKVAYFLILQSGALVGCSQCGDATDVSFTTSAVNGVTIAKKIQAGIGVGFDTYLGWQTLPVYASLGYDLFGNKNGNAFFIRLNYGFSKAWRLDSFRGYSFQKAEGGRMFAPQAGYRIKYHDLNLSFAVGVRFQRVFSYYEYPTWTMVNGEYQPSTNNSIVKQDMTRLMITMAVGL
jgi:hypothetical protein